MTRFLVAAAVLLSIPAGAQAPDAGAAPTPPEKPPLNLELMPFTTDTVKKVVAYNSEKVQTCYEETLASKTKPVEGRVMTSFVVTPGGLVKNARVLSKGTTLKDPKLHACLIEVLSTFTFPKPSDRREHPIEYPFNLKAVR